MQVQAVRQPSPVQTVAATEQYVPMHPQLAAATEEWRRERMKEMSVVAEAWLKELVQCAVSKCRNDLMLKLDDFLTGNMNVSMTPSCPYFMAETMVRPPPYPFLTF